MVHYNNDIALQQHYTSASIKIMILSIIVLQLFDIFPGCENP